MQTIQPAEQQPPPWLGQTLFSDNFLRERLPLHQCWKAEGLEKIHRQLSEAYTAFREVYKAEDEENTRHEWIDKVLQILG